MKKITIGYLYPEYMNIYGDTGNIITLIRRGQLHEIEVAIKKISKNDSLATGEIDLYFFGGGQDQQQVFVSEDIQRFKNAITQDIENGAVALTICGGYQLFGRFYRPFEGEDLQGIEVFPIETYASNTRMINNLVVEITDELHSQISNVYSEQWNIPKTLVGFENHSGQTQLPEHVETLGKTLYGYGNNETKSHEGCRVHNAFGSYMHGSLLPKNPHFADFLISKAVEYRYQEPIKLAPQQDTFALKAHNQIVTHFK